MYPYRTEGWILKKKQLLDVIFASDKRKNVLLMLHDGPQEMELILAHLDTTRQALLPQMKILKEHHLIYQSDDSYGLTGMGKIVVDEMEPFLNTIETLDENSNYLEAHNIDAIPEPFLKRINHIRGCTIIEPSIVNSHDMNADYLEVALRSRKVYFVFTFMHPSCPLILSQLANSGVNIEIIFSKELVLKLRDSWNKEFKHFLGYENIRFYQYDEYPGISSITVTDEGFLLRLLFNNNEFSNKQLICGGSKGRQWGKDLYDHYRKNATLITEIE